MFDALEAEMKRALDLRCDALTTPEHLAVLQRCERIRRWLPAVEHPVINQLSAQADAAARFCARHDAPIRSRKATDSVVRLG